jgi:hypothetical protein
LGQCELAQALAYIQDFQHVTTNYLLIDYENVQPKSLELLNEATFKVLVFVGANQTKLSLEFAKSLQALGPAAEYVQISGNCANNLDFHIAFTIGELSKDDPTAHFYIISKDSGFDPLIKYANAKGLRISRQKSIADIPLLRSSNGKNLDERIEAIIKNLKPRGTSRPRRVKTLRNTVNGIFQNALADSELESLINELKKRGQIFIEGERVNYHLDGEP